MTAYQKNCVFELIGLDRSIRELENKRSDDLIKAVKSAIKEKGAALRILLKEGTELATVSLSGDEIVTRIEPIDKI